jgi:hypothetical protein
MLVKESQMRTSMTDPVAADTQQEVLALVNQFAAQLDDQPDPPDTSGLPVDLQPDEPPPVPALRALTLIRSAADDLLAQFASRARRAGLSWADMVGPLSLPDQDAEEYEVPAAYGILAPDHRYTDLGRVEESIPGLTAYWVAGGRPDVLVVWDCASCHGEISDWGPTFHPAETEDGHAEGCERFAATMRVWKASQPGQDGAFPDQLRTVVNTLRERPPNYRPGDPPLDVALVSLLVTDPEGALADQQTRDAIEWIARTGRVCRVYVQLDVDRLDAETQRRHANLLDRLRDNLDWLRRNGGEQP